MRRILLIPSLFFCTIAARALTFAPAQRAWTDDQSGGKYKTRSGARHTFRPKDDGKRHSVRLTLHNGCKTELNEKVCLLDKCQNLQKWGKFLNFGRPNSTYQL